MHTVLTARACGAVFIGNPSVKRICNLNRSSVELVLVLAT